MLKNDLWIIEQAKSKGMIIPFVPRLVSRVENNPVISYGTSSYGYDIRLSPNEFRVFRRIPGTLVNPKKFNPKNLESVPLHTSEDGDFLFFLLIPMD